MPITAIKTDLPDIKADGLKTASNPIADKKPVNAAVEKAKPDIKTAGEQLNTQAPRRGEAKKLNITGNENNTPSTLENLGSIPEDFKAAEDKPGFGTMVKNFLFGGSDAEKKINAGADIVSKLEASFNKTKTADASKTKEAETAGILADSKNNKNVKSKEAETAGILADNKKEKDVKTKEAETAGILAKGQEAETAGILANAGANFYAYTAYSASAGIYTGAPSNSGAPSNTSSSSSSSSGGSSGSSSACAA